MQIRSIGPLLLLFACSVSAADSTAFQLHAVAEKPSATTVQYTQQLRDGRKEMLHLEMAVLMDGSAVKSAKVEPGQDGKPQVLITFTEEGKKQFAEATTKYVGKRIAILLDGKLETAPTVNEPILGGSAVITGNYTEGEAASLAKRLNGDASK